MNKKTMGMTLTCGRSVGCHENGFKTFSKMKREETCWGWACVVCELCCARCWIKMVKQMLNDMWSIYDAFIRIISYIGQSTCFLHLQKHYSLQNQHGIRGLGHKIPCFNVTPVIRFFWHWRLVSNKRHICPSRYTTYECKSENALCWCPKRICCVFAQE